LQRYLLDEIAMALLDDKIQEGASISIDEQWNKLVIKEVPKKPQI
jgi:hypothetical protein